MAQIPRFSPLLALGLLGACTTMPSGPGVLVLPGTGKSFDQFHADDVSCRQFAHEQVGVTPTQAATDSGARSALVGTILGAAAGAAINGGTGAAVGAGAGLALGGLVGTGTAEVSGYALQQRYDYGYEQCMYAKGHRVPVYTSHGYSPYSGYYHPPTSEPYGPHGPAPGSAPPASTEPAPPASAPTTAEFRYYCPDSNQYYPEIGTCPSRWMRVVPGAVTTPPGPPPSGTATSSSDKA
jgi:hypothetical protein